MALLSQFPTLMSTVPGARRLTRRAVASTSRRTWRTGCTPYCRRDGSSRPEVPRRYGGEARRGTATRRAVASTSRRTWRTGRTPYCRRDGSSRPEAPRGVRWRGRGGAPRRDEPSRLHHRICVKSECRIVLSNIVPTSIELIDIPHEMIIRLLLPDSPYSSEFQINGLCRITLPIPNYHPSVEPLFWHKEHMYMIRHHNIGIEGVPYVREMSQTILHDSTNSIFPENARPVSCIQPPLKPLRKEFIVLGPHIVSPWLCMIRQPGISFCIICGQL